MKQHSLSQSLCCLLLMLELSGLATADEVSGVKVSFVGDAGAAKLSARLNGKYELRIDVDLQSTRGTPTLQVELPIAGPNAWPTIDVAVFDPEANALPVRRGGIEWHKLFITVRPDQSALFVRAIDPSGDQPEFRPETERKATDPATGLNATISRWYDRRQAALSLRFDDSHPTHLSKAIPILNEYGFRGTFMINPAVHPSNSRQRSAFAEHLAEWEAVAKRGNHELANHTMNHRGAQSDESMESEIGDAAQTIWKLCPERSRLAALNLGGGTQWVTTKPLRYYLDKYHLFDASANSTGMDDSYGDRVAKFRSLLENHIRRGLWYKVHYHSIGEGFSSSEANFRAALDIVKEHQDQLWIAGMADIHKYEIERRGASLEVENKGQSRSLLKLSCTTDPELYDQPLTIEVTLPEAWATERVVVTGDGGQAVKTRTVSTADGVLLSFHVEPTSAEYLIEKTARLNSPEPHRR